MWTLIVRKFFDYFFRVNFGDSFLNLDNLKFEKMSELGVHGVTATKRETTKRYVKKLLSQIGRGRDEKI